MTVCVAHPSFLGHKWMMLRAVARRRGHVKTRNHVSQVPGDEHRSPRLEISHTCDGDQLKKKRQP